MTTVNKTIIQSQHHLSDSRQATGGQLLCCCYRNRHLCSTAIILLMCPLRKHSLSFHCFTFLSFYSLCDSTGGSYRCTNSPSCCSCQKHNFLLLKVKSSRITLSNVWKLDIVLRNSRLDFPFARRKKIIQVMKTHGVSK